MKRRAFIVIAFGIILLMVIGSFADLEISTALFNTQSIFANIFAAYGELPIGIFMLIPAYILLFCHDGQKTIWKVLSIILGIMLAGGALYFLTINPTRYLRQYLWPKTSSVLVAAIGVVIAAGIIFGMTKYTKGTDHKELRKLALVCFLMVYGALIIINLIKIPWGRPRMRLIAVNGLASFQPWWVAGSEQTKILLAQGVAKDELSSFPSGHTADAAVMLCLSFMALTKKKTSLDPVLFFAGIAYAAAVAFSRIIMGAHFLTDVVFGFAVTFILYLIFKAVFFSEKPRVTERA